MDREELAGFLRRRREALDAPAQIVSDLGVTVTQNRLAEALVGPGPQPVSRRR